MPRARHTGYRSGLQVAPSMIDESSSFLPSAVNTAPLPGIEQRIVLENLDRRFNRIQRRAALVQHLRSGFNRLGQSTRDRPLRSSGPASFAQSPRRRRAPQSPSDVPVCCDQPVCAAEQQKDRAANSNQCNSHLPSLSTITAVKDFRPSHRIPEDRS